MPWHFHLINVTWTPPGQYLAQGHICTWRSQVSTFCSAPKSKLLNDSCFQQLANPKQKLNSQWNQIAKAARIGLIPEAKTVHCPATIVTSRVASVPMCRHSLREFLSLRSRGFDGSFIKESKGYSAYKNVKEIWYWQANRAWGLSYYMTHKTEVGKPQINILSL